MMILKRFLLVFGPGHLEQVLLSRVLFKCLFSKPPRYRRDHCYTMYVYVYWACVGLFAKLSLRFNNNKPNPLSSL